MNVKLALFLFLAATQAASSAFGQVQPLPVTDPNTPLQLHGFRIKPPPGPYWYVVARDDRNVMFAKKTESRVHTFLAIAFSRELKASPSSRVEFLEFAKDFKAAGVERDRIEMLEEEFVESSDPAPDCARYRMRSRDRGAWIAKGDSWLLEQAGVVCLHPVSRRHLIDVRYSERGAPELPNVQMRTEGEAFIRSLEFTPVN